MRAKHVNFVMRPSLSHVGNGAVGGGGFDLRL